MGNRSTTPNVFFTEVPPSAMAAEMAQSMGIRSTSSVFRVERSALESAGHPVFQNPSHPGVYNAVTGWASSALFRKEKSAMAQRPPHLADLPTMTTEVCTVQILREQGYVTLAMRSPEGKLAGVFTLDAVEAKKLGEQLVALAAGADGSHSLVEGAHVGGPPTPAQLMR